MADEHKAPVAIRITRPYANEQEYLEREFDTLTRTSVILLGAQSRPQGVVLRFEIVLKNGDSMLRGEGRVVAYKEKAYAGEPGLSLRFTRLDARSKALVDRAATMREARVRASTSLMGMPAVVVPKPGDSATGAGAVPPPPVSVPMSSSALVPSADSSASLDALLGPDSSPPVSSSAAETSRKPPASPPPPPPSRRAPPPLPEWARSQIPPALPSSVDVEVEIESTQVDANFDRAAPPPLRVETPRPPPLPTSRPASVPPPRPASMKPPPRPPMPSRFPKPNAGSLRAVSPPADRDALLLRLRTRARSLPAERVSEILAKRAART